MTSGPFTGPHREFVLAMQEARAELEPFAARAPRLVLDLPAEQRAALLAGLVDLSAMLEQLEAWARHELPVLRELAADVGRTLRAAYASGQGASS